MSVFAVDLPSPSFHEICERDAVLYGRDLVLDDLAEHPDREPDYYVRAAVFHVYAAALYDCSRRDLLASLAAQPPQAFTLYQAKRKSSQTLAPPVQSLARE